MNLLVLRCAKQILGTRVSDGLTWAYRTWRQKRKYPFWQYIPLRDEIKPDVESWVKIRKLSKIVSANPWLCRPSMYEHIVKRFDRELGLPALHDARFIGRGSGTWNLNAYRYGTLEGQPVFEKIYLAESDAWTRVAWAYEKMLPQLHGAIKTPRLLYHVRGERLAAAYFEFMPYLTPVSKDQVFQEAVAFRAKIENLRYEKGDPELTNFSKMRPYVEGAAELRKILMRAGTNPLLQKTIEAQICQMSIPIIFSHGDFFEKNIGVGGWIWDWDMCGMYPDGYEFAYVLSLTQTFDEFTCFERFADKYIVSANAGGRLSLYYFASVFYSGRRYRMNASETFILSLFNRARELSETPT